MNQIKRDPYRLRNYHPEPILTGRTILGIVTILGLTAGFGYGMGRILPSILYPHKSLPPKLPESAKGPGRGVYR